MRLRRCHGGTKANHVCQHVAASPTHLAARADTDRPIPPASRAIKRDALGPSWAQAGTWSVFVSYGCSAHCDRLLFEAG